ncbi:sodium-dependent transporter, partial [Enterobacter hormaechei subsp. steigerwaltii]|nr:sodium-dependent transporter [Enterobacter hormaechei subsp. steigerwaltii]
MPLLFLFLIAMVVRNVTLPGAMEGVAFYLKPDFSKITAELFVFVLGQVFFALSLGFGVMITLSSYLDKNENLVQTAVITAITNTIIAILAGFMIFPSLFSFGVAPALIAYKWQLWQFGKIGYSVAFIYCACAALRLALFNTLIGKVDKRWFIGV